MRTLLILGALLAMTVAAQAQLSPEQQMEAQQQAINKRRADLQNCQRMYQGQLSAGVNAQQAQQAYNHCQQMADDNYNTALSRIGLQGRVARCTRPDGCPEVPTQSGSGNGSTSQPGRKTSPPARTPPGVVPECCKPGQGHLPTGQ